MRGTEQKKNPYTHCVCAWACACVCVNWSMVMQYSEIFGWFKKKVGNNRNGLVDKINLVATSNVRESYDAKKKTKQNKTEGENM